MQQTKRHLSVKPLLRYEPAFKSDGVHTQVVNRRCIQRDNTILVPRWFLSYCQPPDVRKCSHGWKWRLVLCDIETSPQSSKRNPLRSWEQGRERNTWFFSIFFSWSRFGSNIVDASLDLVLVFTPASKAEHGRSFFCKAVLQLEVEIFGWSWWMALAYNDNVNIVLHDMNDRQGNSRRQRRMFGWVRLFTLTRLN